MSMYGYGTPVDSNVIIFYLHKVHGNWNNWTSWTACNVTCGGGTQIRDRLCNDPAPANNGTDCVGGASESAECNTQGCPG